MKKRIIEISDYIKKTEVVEENNNNFTEIINNESIKDRLEKEYKDLIKEYNNLEDLYKNT